MKCYVWHNSLISQYIAYNLASVLIYTLKRDHILVDIVLNSCHFIQPSSNFEMGLEANKHNTLLNYKQNLQVQDIVTT